MSGCVYIYILGNTSSLMLLTSCYSSGNHSLFAVCTVKLVLMLALDEFYIPKST